MSIDVYRTRLDFAKLEKSFYDVFEDAGKVYIEIVRTYYGELNADKLWDNCKQIEKIWEEIVLKHKTKLKWLFFGDYPTSVNTYLYKNRIYGKKLSTNHLDRGIILFDLIPLTISYKNNKTNFEKNAYINVFNKFEEFRKIKWNLLKYLVDEYTKFGLTYMRQDGYKTQLKEECKSLFDFDVQIESWTRDYGTSCDIYDRIEKMILIFD